MNQSPIANMGLLEKLSYDIISKIFSYLDQQDCLNCMETCREWYNHIPQFTQANWKRFPVNSRGISQSQERNLGKHVNHVSFYDCRGDFLSNKMQKLLDCECTEIGSLEFDYCISGTTEKEQNVFLNLLRRLASHRLTHLTLEDHDLNFSILDLLSVCPHLTHFSYRAVTVSFRLSDCNKEPVQLLPYDQTPYKALIYLHMNVVTPSIQYQVLSILHKTPNLKYFIGAQKNICEQRSQMLITPELVFSLCPKLECYIDDASYEQGETFIRNVLQQTRDLLPTTATTNINSNSSGNNDQKQNLLQYLSLCTYKNVNPITFVFSKYKDAIKHIRLVGSGLEFRNNPSGWTRTFRTVSMQHLRTLYFDDIDYSMKSIITLLNTCCVTIQEVQLQNSNESHTLDVPTLQSLQTLPQLRTLIIKPVTFVDEYSAAVLFKRLPFLENLIFEQKESTPLPEEAAPFLKNLRNLTLEETYILGEDETRLTGPLLVSPNFFVSLSQSGSKVESVTLKDGKDMYHSKGVGIPFLALHGLGTLPSLKFLDVRGIERNFNGERNEEKEEQYMLKFLNNFLCGCDNNLNSNITTVASPSKIEELIIYDVSKLTYKMFNILSDFQNLRKLFVFLAVDDDWDNIESPMPADSMCLNVDLYGVLELLRRCKTLEHISFMGVKSCGEHRPSYYLEKKLVEQQQNDTQLQKYYMFEGDFYNVGKNNMIVEHSVAIINTQCSRFRKSKIIYKHS